MNTLECCLWSGKNDELYDKSSKIPLGKDWVSLHAERPTSFVLEGDDNQLQLSVPSNESIYLLIRSSDNEDDNDNNRKSDLLFLLGGLEIDSNARNIELYQSPFPKKGNADAMQYVSTHRGTKREEDHEESYKTIVIMENKAPSSLVALKLLSIRKDKKKPNAEKKAKVSCLKIKAKVIALPASSPVPQKISEKTQTGRNISTPKTSFNVSSSITKNPLQPGSTGHTAIPSKATVTQQQSIFSSPRNESSGSATTEDNLVKAISALNINLQAMETRLQTQMSKQFSQIQTMIYQESQRRRQWEQNTILQFQQQQKELLEKLAENNNIVCSRIEQKQLLQEKDENVNMEVRNKEFELDQKKTCSTPIEADTESNVDVSEGQDMCSIKKEQEEKSNSATSDNGINNNLSTSTEVQEYEDSDGVEISTMDQALGNDDSNVKQQDESDIIHSNTNIANANNDVGNESTKRWIQQFSTELMDTMERKYGSALLRIVEQHEKKIASPSSSSPLHLKEHKTRQFDDQNNDLMSWSNNDNIEQQNNSNLIAHSQWNHQNHHNTPQDLFSTQYDILQDEILIPLSGTDKSMPEQQLQSSSSDEYNELLNLQVEGSSNKPAVEKFKGEDNCDKSASKSQDLGE